MSGIVVIDLSREIVLEILVLRGLPRDQESNQFTLFAVKLAGCPARRFVEDFF